ncbi:peptidase S66 [Pedobacter antarcticus 4BY]|uniref:Peptidase S66 n=2 Tax=Pedobacter antarcticus TaxID=34086 RepID=A0A081PIS6_9SPHI|nr:LD-carboxypeptidase [Pedobacter antarcticus]KEQ30599.1 peptidase S66 [Pedobacter antarcticus 4BY]SFF18733.1 muramoyltetrapeptide carboxypeptidase [Pedobacter antarcticus]
MNRKYFLSSLLTAGAALTSMGSWATPVSPTINSSLKVPPFLKPGDTIGICSPSGFISLADIAPAVQLMESWGYRVLIGSSPGQQDFIYGGTDLQRAKDLQQMLDDPEVKAIMCARGGYGVVRIIDQLDFSGFKKKPKWIIGFSDITVLHCHISRNFNIATLHSKMCNSFPKDWTKAEPVQIETILSIRQALAGEESVFSAPFNPFNRLGVVTAELVGGNLSIIETLAGTASDLKTKGRILFIEDVDESLYRIDRMLWNLKRTGKLDNLAGLVVGGFKLKPDEPGEEFGRDLYEIVNSQVKDFNYPVCYDFPVGHQKNNFALKCGMVHKLEVGAQHTFLTSVRISV